MTAKHTPLPELAAKFNGRVQCGPDMWILRDCPLGVNMITLGVPHGDKLTAPAVAHCFNAYPDLVEALKWAEMALVDYRAGVTKGYPQKAEIIIREALQKAGVK